MIAEQNDFHEQRVSRKMIMKKLKVKVMYDEMTKNGEENDSNIDSLASSGWLRNFMKRNGLSLQSKKGWLTSLYHLFCMFHA